MDMSLYALCKTYADNLVAGGGAIQGISVVDLEINSENHLICYLSNATTIDAGLIDTIIGPPGDKGEPGVGISIGGTTGQVLTKKSDIDYDTEWVDVGSEIGDMVKSIYDPTAKNVDAFNMDNMSDGINYVKTENNFTDTEKTKLGNMAENANVSGVNTGDETNETILAKIGYTPEDVADKGQALGYCALDGGGKVPLANLPATILKYIGTWDATTNTPTLTNPDTTKIGNVYNVSVAGTQFGITFGLGDWLIYNSDGNVEKSDNADDVVSVNGKTGVVTLTTSDVADYIDKRYVSDAQIVSIDNTMNIVRADDGTSFTGASPRDADTLGGNYPVTYTNPPFTEATTLANVVNGDSNSTMWGKVSKYITTNGANISSLAPAYSATSTYATGAYVIYANKLYRCTTAILAGEAFNIAKWTESNFTEWSSLEVTGTMAIGANLTDMGSGLSKIGKQVSLSLDVLTTAIKPQNTALYILPVGYRPTRPHYINIRCLLSALPCRYVYVGTDGVVACGEPTSIESGVYVIGEVTFPTA